MTVSRPPYTRGLHQLSDRSFAWLVPDGMWGLSNAGLVTGSEESLLVDTLFDLALTRELLEGMRTQTERAPIRTLVNTHSNGDHWFGNELVSDAEIISSADTLQEMRSAGPDSMNNGSAMSGAVGKFVRHIRGPFTFTDITATLPTRTFDRTLELDVGGTAVVLYNLGPAHTRGDTVVYVPDTGTLYAGDLLFIGGTPIVWSGPISNWVQACQFMLDLDTDVIVPGHGPVTDNAGVQDVMDYLQYVQHEATKRHAAGMTAHEAMRDIELGRFAALGERGRLAQNVMVVYYELDPSLPRIDRTEVFGHIADLEGWTD